MQSAFGSLSAVAAAHLLWASAALGADATVPAAVAGLGGSGARAAALPVPYVIADQGSCTYAPENTMVAFRNGFRLGVDALEADVNITADGVPVILHDGTLDRTTDCVGDVRKKTFAQVEECDAAYWWVPGESPSNVPLLGGPPTAGDRIERDPNDGRDYALRGRGVRVPTVREFFEYVVSLGNALPEAQVEIKNIPYDTNFDPSGTRIADALVRLIEEFGLEDKIVVESFFPTSLERVKALNPNIRTVFLTLGSATANYAYVATTPTEISSSDTIAPDFDQAYVDDVHALGKLAVPWLVDTPEDLQRVVGLRVDGMFTCYAACMLQGLGRPVPAPIATPEAGLDYDVAACPVPADPEQASTLVVAHRGGASYAPENTLMAYRNAVRLGADVVEMDVQMTIDDVIVMGHNGSLDPLTDCTGEVNQSAWDEIKDCDAAYWFVPGSGTDGLVPPERDPNPALYPLRGTAVRIPRMDAVFEWFTALPQPRPSLSIEIKDIPYDSNFDPIGDRVADVLVPMVERYGLVSEVVLQSFWPSVLEHIKLANPAIRTQLNVLGSHGAAVASCASGLCEISSPWSSSPDLSAETVEQSQAQGIEVITWTLDTAQDLDTYIAMGVDGIMTNNPGCMLSRLGRPVPQPLLPPEAVALAKEPPLCR